MLFRSLAKVFAADSPISAKQVRYILLRNVAGPDLLRQQIAKADYIDGMLKAIVGFALPMERLIGKRKLSQNRSPADMAGVREGLAASPDVRDQALGHLIPQGVAQ